MSGRLAALDSSFSSYSAEHLSATNSNAGLLTKFFVSAATLLNIYLQRGQIIAPNSIRVVSAATLLNIYLQRLAFYHKSTLLLNNQLARIA